jgi:multiple sugar transport system substrate-binding protein
MIALLVAAALLLGGATVLFAEGEQEASGSTEASNKLVINSNWSDPAPKRVMGEVIEKFRERNPELDVTLNTFAHEDYKTLLRTWLNSDEAPDVVTWFAGERMRFFASKGLLEPLGNVFEEQGGFNSYFPSAFRTSSQYDGKVYFMPENWYWWGVYYKESMFEEYGIEEPETWDEFLQVAQTFKDNDITPIAIGTKYKWTAAGWFDYLNLRINGQKFHEQLTAGEIPYNDPRVQEVFEKWSTLVERDFFLDDHTSYSWQEAATRLFNGNAGMYLMGQFIKDSAPNEEVKDDLDFFRFPVINEDMGLYEETPIDGFMIPSRAKNKQNAAKFLRFMASTEMQAFVAEELGRLAANKNVEPPDEHAAAGLEMIENSDGVMQFYDRDTNPEMASTGMDAFVQFMVQPGKMDSILDNLESERQNIYDE